MQNVGGWLCACLLLSGCAHGYDARGLVLATNATARTITISHEPIPGLMDAMAMPFDVAHPRDLAAVAPGDRITFRLRIAKEGSRVDRVRVLSAAREDEGLSQSPAQPVLVPIGGAVPDVTLTDQDGASLSVSSLRGHVVAVNFIYTRCPLPEYCPRLVSSFSVLQRRFAGRLGRDLTLLTVTFDPRYDTPSVLKQFAKQFDADVPAWRFLTGTPEAIARFCHGVGVQYWPEEGLITHTLMTAVIDREGRLAAAVEGKEFTAKQLGDLIDQVMR
jgi:protein SCO1/2